MTDPVAVEGKVADLKNFFQIKINALEDKTKNLSASVQGSVENAIVNTKAAVNNAQNTVAAKISGNVEPSPQAGQNLVTGLGGPAAGGRRRRTRKSKKSSKKGKKRSSRKGKKRSTKKRVRFSRRK